MENAPFVVSGKINGWESSAWTTENLTSIIKDKLIFRIGKKNKDGLQYETDCSYVEASIEEFVQWLTADETKLKQGKKIDDADSECLSYYKSDSYWAYADYKYMKNLFRDRPTQLDAVDWSVVGLSGRNGKDSTLWLGSSGAYTVCHYDTYGCNIVAQIQGRKKWVMFPPEQTQNMYPTRVPFEESSVFSQVNVAHPDLEKHPEYQKSTPYIVVLNPGDLLYVPRHWWHYVECLDTAISINTWIEMGEDTHVRLEEAVVRNIVCSLLQDSDVQWLNPTEEEKDAEQNMCFLNNALEAVSKSSLNTPQHSRCIKCALEDKSSPFKTCMDLTHKEVDRQGDASCLNKSSQIMATKTGSVKSVNTELDNSLINLFFNYLKNTQTNIKYCEKISFEDYMNKFVFCHRLVGCENDSDICPSNNTSELNETLQNIRKRDYDEKHKEGGHTQNKKTKKDQLHTTNETKDSDNENNKDQIDIKTDKTLYQRDTACTTSTDPVFSPNKSDNKSGYCTEKIGLQDNHINKRLSDIDIVNCFVDPEVIALICKKLKQKKTNC